MSPTHPTGHPDAEMLDAARATIAALMDRHHVPGLSIAVTDTDRLLSAPAFGPAALTPRRPATADTRYLWFSMSKIATATAALQLADQGRLDVDAPVSSFVPS